MFFTRKAKLSNPDDGTENSTEQTFFNIVSAIRLWSRGVFELLSLRLLYTTNSVEHPQFIVTEQ